MWSKRPRTERLWRSLTFRLTLTSGLLGYGLVWALAGLVYTTVKVEVQAQVDRDLATTAKVLLHRLDEDRESPSKELLDVGEHLSLRILDARGREVLASPGMAHLAPSDRFPAATPAGAWGDAFPEPQRPVRLLSQSYAGGTVQVARDGRDEAFMLRRLRLTLLWAAALVPLAAGVVGYGLVRFGLRPLGDVAGVVGSVRPESLTTRVHDEDLPTELVPLAGAFNATMGRLQEAFQRLSDLNGDLAHELRTPLHALRLEAEALLADPGLAPGAQEGVAGMMDTLHHLSAAVEQMLLLATLEDPRKVLQRETLEAGPLLDAAAAPFEPLAEERDVRLHTEADTGLGLLGDEVMLRRALHNLVANALRAAPRGSAVRLRARRDGTGVLLEVEDEGPGMAPELVAQIGRRFLRSDASRSSATGGTGLGLALVQGIARLHGGDLAVAARPGGGTVIQIKVAGT